MVLCLGGLTRSGNFAAHCSKSLWCYSGRVDYELAKSLMDAGFPQIGKGRLIGSPDKLVWRNSDRVYVPTLEELIDAVAGILALLINNMTGGSPARMGISIALRDLLPKPSPAYGSRFKNNHRHEGANTKT